MKGKIESKKVCGESGAGTIKWTVVCAAVAAFLAVAAVFVAGALGDEAEENLRNDVRALNGAIDVYRVFGGSLEGLKSPEEVLAKLKSRGGISAEEAAAGLHDNVVDHSLRAEMQTEEEAASSAPRAVWNKFTKRFEIAYGGVRGVKRFIMGDDLASLAFVPENRSRSSVRNSDNSWMWDYEDSSPEIGASAKTVQTGTSAKKTVVETAPVSRTAGNLEAPLFSVAGGRYSITDFNLGLEFANPNARGMSRIRYSVNGGAWMRYDEGTSVRVRPGAKVAAFCESTDGRWSDSVKKVSSYGAEPVTLEMPAIEISSLQFDFDNNRLVRVAIRNPNLANNSKLEYRVNGSPWSAYNDSIELNGKGFIEEDAEIQVRAKATADYFYDSPVNVATILRPGSAGGAMAGQSDSTVKAGGSHESIPRQIRSKGGPDVAAAALGRAL